MWMRRQITTGRPMLHRCRCTDFFQTKIKRCHVWKMPAPVQKRRTPDTTVTMGPTAAYNVMKSPHRLRGGDLGGDWGDGPPKFEVGGRHMHPSPPNILRSSVVGCARKYEQSVRKGSYTSFNIV